jgi:hypothetical protein
MKDIENETLAGTEPESATETVDTGRRHALARLGLTAAVAYAVPTLLPLTPASADSDSSGGGSNSNDDGSNGNDHGSDSNDHGSDSNDNGSDGDGPDHDDMDPTQPTEPTEPSDSFD